MFCAAGKCRQRRFKEISDRGWGEGVGGGWGEILHSYLWVFAVGIIFHELAILSNKKIKFLSPGGHAYCN